MRIFAIWLPGQLSLKYRIFFSYQLYIIYLNLNLKHPVPWHPEVKPVRFLRKVLRLELLQPLLHNLPNDRLLIS